MTSASELFHNRRSRFGRNVPELGLGGSSSSFSFERALPSSHNHQHQHGRRPSRHHHHHSNDRNRRGSRHLYYQEHESVQVDHAAINPGNSSVGGGTSSRINRMQSARSERLPGDVLLARERLVERLRSISLSSPSDRQRTRSALGVPSNDISHDNEYRLIDARIWESGPTLAWIAGLYPYSYPTSQTSVLSSLQDSSTTRPRGLNLAEADSLHREVFVTTDVGETSMVEPVQECSICLDSFSEGEELICLPCEHKFHSACLYPWIRTCGDCPNCRAGIIIYKE